jgi:hypothetical protein
VDDEFLGRHGHAILPSRTDVRLQSRAFLERDNGTPGQPTRDRSSPLFNGPLGDTGWPAGFPYTCPAPDSPINTVGFQALHSGDVVISAGQD